MASTPIEQRPLHESEIANNEAQAQEHKALAAKANAEATKAKAEAREATIKAERAQIELDREQHKRRKELAADEFFHTFLFDSEVTETSVKTCLKQLAAWERNSEAPITVELVIHSPGGSVFDGFALIDYINGMHARGHTINTVAYGMAASMGGVLLQVGKTRAMGSNALLLIHEASFGVSGQFGKIEDQVKMVELMHDRILSLFAERSNLSKATISRRWRRRDWWIDSNDCLKHGFVDEVR